ncbi:MAG: hypothetical protein ACRC3Y_17230 [Romboutsia sp.]|uniref:hypothetical protein n=1 Tax=Romboutsia sp. TaxID=1965302 RepID=UPI003F351726
MKKIYSILLALLLFVSSFSFTNSFAEDGIDATGTTEDDSIILELYDENNQIQPNILNSVVFEQVKVGDYTEIIVRNNSKYHLSNMSIKLDIERYDHLGKWVKVRSNTYSGVNLYSGGSKSLGKKYDPRQYGLERAAGNMSVIAAAKNYQGAGTKERVNNPYNWNSIKTLADHTYRHRGDFGLAYDEIEYSRQANLLYKNRVKKGYQYKIDNNGSTIRVYHVGTNSFGSYDLSGRSKTYFKPSNGKAYFDKQQGTLYIGNQ